MIKYFPADDIRQRIEQLIGILDMGHIDMDRITCVRSRGSSSRRIVARCHALPKIMQHALQRDAHYVIEVISERFDRLSDDVQVKTLIHELLHIPKSFGGGFRHHDYVCSRNVENMYRLYVNYPNINVREICKQQAVI